MLEITVGRMSLQTASAADLTAARELLASESFNLCLDRHASAGRRRYRTGFKLHPTTVQRCRVPVAVYVRPRQHRDRDQSPRGRGTRLRFRKPEWILQKLRDLVQAALRLTHKHGTARRCTAGGRPQTAEAPSLATRPTVRQLREQIGQNWHAARHRYISAASLEPVKNWQHAPSISRAPAAPARLSQRIAGAIPEDPVESELFGHTARQLHRRRPRDKQGLVSGAPMAAPCSWMR